MHIVDSKIFKQALHKKGYRSIGELAKSLNIHRNTIHYYLSGHGVFPANFEKIITALDIKPRDILIEDKKDTSVPLEQIAPIVDQLSQKFPNVCFILFGSRSKKTAQKFSDWDIGVYSSEGLPHNAYRQIVRLTNDLVENLPICVDIVNLNQADDYFLQKASKYWIFLSGKLNAWVNLQKKVFI